MASKIVALYNKPTFVFSFINNIGSGSGRSIDQIDIGSIVLELKANDLIEDGGGHKMAVGLKIDKKKSKYVAVVVKNDESTLEKIKDLPFDYYQMYDCSPGEIIKIKEKYNKKIITALTIENEEDVKKYKDYKDISEIILFDSKGYEKSMSFDHNLLNEVDDPIEKMIAGNIQIDDIPSFKNKDFIIDLSGSIENNEGKKDLNKILVFR